MALATDLPEIPPARQVPMTFSQSFKSWWAVGQKDSALSEERLLRKLPFFQSSTWPQSQTGSGSKWPITASISQVALSNPKHYINAFSIVHNNPTSNPTTTTSPSLNSNTKQPSPVVLLHGYGAGLGFFFLNFPSLSTFVSSTKSPIYALDWLGMGRSSRPPFTISSKKHDTPGRVHEAESFFVDSLEEWRVRMGVEKMTLVGHSLGAYFSVVYALRYPGRVGRLVLLSPAGVTRPDPEETTEVEREMTDDQDEAQHGRRTGNGAAVQPAPPSKVNAVRGTQHPRAKPQPKSAKKEELSRSRRFFQYAWEEGWSPFQVVRCLGFWAPMVVGKYSSRRFSGLTEEEVRNMNDYILNITLAKGSGEYCISHILAPFAQARLPLVDRIEALKIPVTFVYGDHDWMDPLGGLESVEKLKQAGNRHAKMSIVQQAGHHVYLDNPDAVNEILLKEMNKG